MDRRARSSWRARVQRASFIQHVARIGNASRMPPKGDPLTADQIGELRAWIDQGAITLAVTGKAPAKSRKLGLGPPETASGPGDTRRTQKWVRNPVDAFVLQKLLANGLVAVSPEADRRTLIRRLSLDLTGLPPTPRGDRRVSRRPVAECLREARRSAARQSALRRALGPALDGRRPLRRHARPRPGRPAAQCLAVPRLPDPLVQRRQALRPLRPGADRRRRALSRRSQPRSSATGFLAAGPWDESGLAGIREDSLDRQIAHYLDRDDMVTTTMSTFAEPDRRLRPLPRSQVRPDHAGGLLRPPGRLRRDRQGGTDLRRGPASRPQAA